MQIHVTSTGFIHCVHISKDSLREISNHLPKADKKSLRLQTTPITKYKIRIVDTKHNTQIILNTEVNYTEVS